jgi:hypothetical protein
VLALLAQAAEGNQSPLGGFGLLVPAALFFVIFYFIVMRPQAKQQNAHKSFLDKLGKGDEVRVLLLRLPAAWWARLIGSPATWCSSRSPTT